VIVFSFIDKGKKVTKVYRIVRAGDMGKQMVENKLIKYTPGKIRDGETLIILRMSWLIMFLSSEKCTTLTLKNRPPW